MDPTFLQIVALLVNLSNQVAALQQENATLKANLPVHEVETAQAAD
jgi:hypothetical protein